MVQTKIKSFGDIYKDKLAEEKIDTKEVAEITDSSSESENDLAEMLDLEEISGLEGTQAAVEVTLHDDNGNVRERRFDSREPILEVDEDNVESVANALKNVKPDSIADALKDVKEALTPTQTGVPAAEILLILEAINKLIDKIDRLVLTPPTIHIPAPIIEVTLPDIKRTVLKEVVREKTKDGKVGVIDHVIETTVDKKISEAKAQVLKTKTPPRKKTTRRKRNN